MSDEDLEILDSATCLGLLGTLDVGRCAWVGEDGRVVVLPVNFAIEEGDIIFRSAAGAKLAAARAGQRFSFEGDDIEPALRTGWSVLVTGHASEVSDPQEAARLAQLVHPWARDERPNVVRLHAEQVTGRRLRLHAAGTRVVYLDPGSGGAASAQE
jgi:nitroimidazol reductase NimA-like FMN-containing flavoprotein (pyridoxamine 5'-phosphate oxidase superfamily)